MGLVIAEKNLKTLQKIAERERSPIYMVGEVTENHKFTFESKTKGDKPMDFELEDMFGSSPKTILNDKTIIRKYKNSRYKIKNLQIYLEQVLQLEAVACKDWLTNKVDRCVGGKVAKQQCAGPLQLPLNNVGVMALDFKIGDGNEVNCKVQYSEENLLPAVDENKIRLVCWEMLEETNATVDIPDNISELTLKIKGNTYGCMDDWGNKAFEAYSFFAGNEDKNLFF